MLCSGGCGEPVSSAPPILTVKQRSRGILWSRGCGLRHLTEPGSRLVFAPKLVAPSLVWSIQVRILRMTVARMRKNMFQPRVTAKPRHTINCERPHPEKKGKMIPINLSGRFTLTVEDFFPTFQRYAIISTVIWYIHS